MEQVSSSGAFVIVHGSMSITGSTLNEAGSEQAYQSSSKCKDSNLKKDNPLELFNFREARVCDHCQHVSNKMVELLKKSKEDQMKLKEYEEKITKLSDKVKELTALTRQYEEDKKREKEDTKTLKVEHSEEMQVKEKQFLKIEHAIEVNKLEEDIRGLKDTVAKLTRVQPPSRYYFAPSDIETISQDRDEIIDDDT